VRLTAERDAFADEVIESGAASSGNDGRPAAPGGLVRERPADSARSTGDHEHRLTGRICHG
jgi:hypothetical protein